jgi:hypothetical protein
MTIPWYVLAADGGVDAGATTDAGYVEREFPCRVRPVAGVGVD